MNEYTMITTDAELNRFHDSLKSGGITALAMDFEGEFNLHIYGEKLCLIQVYDGSRLFAIDPFKIGAPALASLLEDPKLMKLIYDANSDSKTIYKQYGIKLQGVYDLKILVDLMDYDKKGLDAVLERLLGIRVEQKGKFQRYNWTLRPIDKAAVEYALADVEHLFALADELLKAVQEAGKLGELIRALATRSIDYDKKPIPAIKKMQEYLSLGQAKKAVFEKVLEIRENAARELNRPPNDILTKEQVFRIVKDPSSASSISLNPRMPAAARTSLIESLRGIEP